MGGACPQPLLVRFARAGRRASSFVLVSYKSSSIMAGLARRNRYDKSVSRAAFSPTLDRSPSAEEFHWEVNHVPGDPLARHAANICALLISFITCRGAH